MLNTQQHKDNNNIYLHSGIYEIICQICKRSYIGQTGRKLEIRYKEHIRCIKGNNKQSAYAAHILNNLHDFGPIDTTMNLLHRAPKVRRINTLGNYYIQLFYFRKSIIREQTVSKINPLFQLAFNLEPRNPHNAPDTAHSN
jgi:hypothetical protein